MWPMRALDSVMAAVLLGPRWGTAPAKGAAWRCGSSAMGMRRSCKSSPRNRSKKQNAERIALCANPWPR